MNNWESTFSAGDFFIDFSWLAALLVFAYALRQLIPVLRKILLPANLFAGVIALIVGMNGFELLDLNTERLGVYIYHLLALLFIGLALRTPQKNLGLSSVRTGMAFIMTYLIQGSIGLIVAFGLLFTIWPDLFPGIGMLPPLAFGMNPGIAYTFGQNWEAFGFTSGGVVGLTFAAIGFMIAYTAGMFSVKRALKKHVLNSDDSDNNNTVTSSNKLNINLDQTPPEIIESLSLHIGLVGLVYVLTYGLLHLGAELLTLAGAENEIQTLWSFHFLIAAILALILRRIMDAFAWSDVIHDEIMTRISNLFMDLMIVASIAAISLTVALDYWLPLILISVGSGTATWFLMRRLVNSAFEHHQEEHFAAFFGNMTGTLQSGLLLLRLLDPKMKSPVSFNLVYGSGYALILGFPLLLLLNAPVHYFDDPINGFAFVLAALLTYLILLLLGWKLLDRSES